MRHGRAVKKMCLKANHNSKKKYIKKGEKNKNGTYI